MSLTACTLFPTIAGRREYYPFHPIAPPRNRALVHCNCHYHQWDPVLFAAFGGHPSRVRLTPLSCVETGRVEGRSARLATLSERPELYPLLPSHHPIYAAPFTPVDTATIDHTRSIVIRSRSNYRGPVHLAARPNNPLEHQLLQDIPRVLNVDISLDTLFLNPALYFILCPQIDFILVEVPFHTLHRPSNSDPYAHCNWCEAEQGYHHRWALALARSEFTYATAVAIRAQQQQFFIDHSLLQPESNRFLVAPLPGIINRVHFDPAPEGVHSESVTVHCRRS